MPWSHPDGPFFENAAMMEFAPYRLDAVNQCLWRASEAATIERVELTPKTFNVLRYLLEHAGRLVTHDELLDAVWPGVHVQPEVLKGHILAIRNVLGDNAQNPQFIETLRGRGYRFMPSVSEAGSVDPMPSVHRSHGGFVGRAAQLAQLETSLRDAESGIHQLVFVVGEPGVGKTALVEQFLARSASIPGMLVSRGSCVEGYGGSEPYYPVLEALGRLCKGPDGEAIVQALVDLAPTWAVQLPAQISAKQRAALQLQIVGAGPGYMLHEICGLLEVLAQRRPLILVFEDLHWVDYSTVDLLSAIARRQRHSKLMLIATYRPEDAASGQHPVKQLNHELLLRRLCTEITLEPLSEDAVGELLAGDDFPEPREQEFAHLIAERSGGNPLFVRAMLDHLVERGLVDKTSQGWQQGAQLSQIAFEMPRTIVQVIEARIQRLGDEQQRLLEAASVAGLLFSAATVAEAAGLDPAAFDDLCEALARRRCFIHRAEAEISADGQVTQQFRFDHTMFRNVFYARQGLARRAHSHRVIGERMESLCEPGQLSEVALELGQHFAVAGDWQRALEHLRIALQTAQGRFAHQESLAILDLAEMLAQNLAPEIRSATSVALLQSRASLYAAAHDPRAERTYRQLVLDAERLGQLDIQAQALLGLAFTVSWRDQDDSFEILERALQLSAHQTNPQSRATTQICCYVRRLWVRGWCEADVRHCEAALAALRAGDNPLKIAWGLVEYSMLCMISTRYREAQDTIRNNYLAILESVEMRRTFDIARGMWMIRVGIPWTSLFLGEFGKSLEEFDFGIEMFRKNGNYYASRTLKIYRLWLLVHALDFEAVISSCRQLASKRDLLGSGEGTERGEMLPEEKRICIVLSGLAQAGLGRRAAALECLREAERQMETQAITFDWYWRLAAEWGLANLAITGEDRLEARRRAQKFVELAQKTDERTWQALAWETMARMSLSQGDLNGAAESLERAFMATDGYETPLADWRVHHTAASVFEAAGEAERSAAHRQLGMQMKQRLADSLPAGHRLRTIFESA